LLCTCPGPPVAIALPGYSRQVTIGNIVSGALFTGALLDITYGASSQRGKEPVLLESKSPVGLAAEGA
jgi:hypothetical protein